MIRTALTRDPIRPDEVLAAVAAPEDGAVVLFLGVVRDHNDGRPVSGLEYEAYEEMADEVLEELGREVEERWSTDRISIVHRTGALQLGEVSVAIAVSTPHRAEAYEASRYVIEQIKVRLPVWKREHYEDGERRWVRGCRPEPGPGSGEEASAGVARAGSRRER